MQRPLIITTVLLAFLAWRNGHIAKQLIFAPTLPAGYYAHGDHTKNCEVIRDPTNQFKFCEDGAFWDVHDNSGALTERRLMLSCDPGRKSWNTVMGPLKNPDPRGALWVLTYGADGAEGTPRRISLDGYPNTKDFHPLGIDISASAAGGASNLFVVNHGRRRTTVEQFKMLPNEPTRAQWVRTLASRYFISPNAIALTSPTSFFVTNDHFLTRRLPSVLGKVLPLFETLLAFPGGYLNHVSIVDESTPGAAVVRYTWPQFGVPFANGIAVSPDGTQVAVASTSLARVHIYARNTTANVIKLTHYVPLAFAPDNIVYDDAGVLLVAGHPHFTTLVKVAADKLDVAPSWVVSVTPREDGEPAVQDYDIDAPYSSAVRAPAVVSHEVQTLYQSDGTGFSSSSTALRDSRTGVLFVAGLYGEGILACHP